MKKGLCILLICFLLMPTAVVRAYTEVDVPYVIDYNFATGNEVYRIDNMRDFRRLLDFAKSMRKASVDIIPADDLSNLVMTAVDEFVNENKDYIQFENPAPGIITNWNPYSVKEYAGITMISFQWILYENWEPIVDRYEAIPVLTTVEECYDVLKACEKDRRYDKVFRISEALLTYKEYVSSGLNTLFVAIEESYGEDVSKYVREHTCDKDAEPIPILIRVCHYSSDYGGESEKDALERQERFERILKNNTILPITEDMTELEKLTVIANSASNVYHSYLITNLACTSPKQKENAYSEGVGQCMHYAQIIKDLCDIYGVECYYVSGDVTWSDDCHAWNIVKYAGNWYLLDRTGDRVRPHDIELEHLSLQLSNEETFEEEGYIWDKEDYPRCTAENIIIDNAFTYEPELADSVIQVAMIEPYQIKDPITTGGEAYYYIWFDTANGKIVAIDTNLSQDRFEKVNGEWTTKETVLQIPAEINGIKVKSIGSHVGWRKKHDAIGSFDHIYFPDNIVLDDFAFAGKGDVSDCIGWTLHFGDNTVIGYGALPHYKTIEKGENVIYKGTYLNASYDFIGVISYCDDFDRVIIRHCDEEDIQIEEGYPIVQYRCGNNIEDRVPTKTLTLPKDVIYIDPRVGWLNRRYIVDEENPNFTTIDGVLYNKDKTKLISVPIGVESIVIPDTVTEIGEYAFSYCNAIEEITIPASVTTVGPRAFWHLSNLKKVWFEGKIPETYSPKLCGEFQTISLEESACERLDYTIEREEKIRVNDIANGGIPFTIFYDVNGDILSFASGAEIIIPDYAKSYKLYVWDENLKPLAFMESGEF